MVATGRWSEIEIYHKRASPLMGVNCDRYVDETNKRLSWRRGTARRATSIEILSNVAQLYKKFYLKRLAIGK